MNNYLKSKIIFLGENIWFVTVYIYLQVSSFIVGEEWDYTVLPFIQNCNCHVAVFSGHSVCMHLLCKLHWTVQTHLTVEYNYLILHLFKMYSFLTFKQQMGHRLFLELNVETKVEPDIGFAGYPALDSWPEPDIRGAETGYPAKFKI